MTDGFCLVFAVVGLTLAILLVGTFLEWVTSRPSFLASKKRKSDGVGRV